MASKPTPHFNVAGPPPVVLDGAACRHEPPGTMEYHGRVTREQLRHLELARDVCRRCPVLAECRSWALSSPDPVPGMVAAQMHPGEREQARRRRS